MNEYRVVFFHEGNSKTYVLTLVAKSALEAAKEATAIIGSRIVIYGMNLIMDKDPRE